MGPHQGTAPFVCDCAPNLSADGWNRVALGRDQIQVLAPANTFDPGFDATPEEDAVIGRLAASAGVEGRPVQDDPLFVAGQDGGIPLAQRLVRQFQPMRAAVGVVAHQAPYGPSELEPRPNERTAGRTSTK